jgi:hypothetical protein
MARQEETMHTRAAIRRSRFGARVLVVLRASLTLTIALAFAGRAAAGARTAQTASTGGSTTAISTSQFVNQFDAEPYVGNGYFSQRIPAAGMGLLTGLGTIGWPLGTPRFTEALAAGLYAKTNASSASTPTRPSR